MGGYRALSPFFCLHFANLGSLPLLFLFLLICGCTTAAAEGDLRPYYLESCHLMEVGHDSLCRFDGKIQTLTRANAISQSDLLFDDILDNIEEAYRHYSTLNIRIDTMWKDTIKYNF